MIIVTYAFNFHLGHKQFAKRHDSSGSKVTWLCSGRPIFDSQQGQGFFSSLPLPDRPWGLPASYPMGNGKILTGCKAAKALSWPLTYIKCRG